MVLMTVFPVYIRSLLGTWLGVLVAGWLGRSIVVIRGVLIRT